MKTTKIVIWSIIAIILITILISILMNRENISIKMFSFEDEKRVVFEKVYKEDIDNINLKWLSGHVNIYESSDNNIKIIQRSAQDLKEDEIVKVEVIDNTIEIVERSKVRFYFFYIGNMGSDVDIYLPQKQYNEIKLKLSSGRINSNGRIECDKFINELTSGTIQIAEIVSSDVDINVTSGKIIIDDIDTDVINAKVTSGNIYIEGSAKDVNLKANSGKIEFANEILPEEMNVDVTSGSLFVKLPENDGFELDYKITSGKLNSDFNLMYSSNSERNGKAKYKQGGNVFTFKVTSGKIDIERI